jgi:hypothetical protein
MPKIKSYNYQFHGGPQGYAGNRAIIRLQDSSDQSVAYVHFVPTGHTIPSDTNNPPWIRMYLPEAAFPGVIDMLRNEKPISVYFAAGSGFLHTGEEPIGEAE